MKKLISFVLFGAALTMADVVYGGDLNNWNWWRGTGLSAPHLPELRRDTPNPATRTDDPVPRADDPEVKISGETSPKGTTGPGCFKTITVCTGIDVRDGSCTQW